MQSTREVQRKVRAAMLPVERLEKFMRQWRNIQRQLQYLRVHG